MAETETFAESVYNLERELNIGAIRVMRLNLDTPTNRSFRRTDRYWLDMCLTPRPDQARGCYRERWGPHRYERLGEIFLVPPGETLHVRTERGGKQDSVICEIDAPAIDRWLEDGIEWTDRRLEAGLDITNAHIRHSMFRLVEELSHPGPGGTVLMDMLMGWLAIEVARYCAAIAEGPITGGLASWRLKIIDARLEQGGPAPTLQELSSLCNVSIRQLTRGFQASRSCSIGDYIAHNRVDRAKRLLDTDASMKEIAFELGFASPSSFSFAFRRATGTTPSIFRQRQLRKRVMRPEA